jgi:hypothetical protein
MQRVPLIEQVKNAMSLADAGKLVGVHASQLHRWSSKGVRGVRLRTFLIGGKRKTAPKLIEEFLQALNAPHFIDEETEQLNARRHSDAAEALDAVLKPRKRRHRT